MYLRCSFQYFAMSTSRLFVALVSLTAATLRRIYHSNPPGQYCGISIWHILDCWYHQEVTGHFVAVLGIARIEQVVSRRV